MKFFKGLLITAACVIGVVVVFGLIASFASEETTVTTKDGKTVTVDKSNGDTTTQDTKKQDAKRITKENYEKIQQGELKIANDGKIYVEGGMTIEEVTAILGEAGTKTKSASSVGDSQSDIESWGYSDFKTGASIFITFTNGKVTSKTFSEI